MSKKKVLQDKVITVQFAEAFLDDVDKEAKRQGFGRRNDYIKAVLRKDVYANKPLPSTVDDVK